MKSLDQLEERLKAVPFPAGIYGDLEVIGASLHTETYQTFIRYHLNRDRELTLLTPVGSFPPKLSDDEVEEIKQRMEVEFDHGVYQHYKGGVYSTVGISFCTEDGVHVDYHNIINRDVLFSRPLEMFSEPVKGMPRFALLAGDIEELKDRVNGHSSE